MLFLFNCVILKYFFSTFYITSKSENRDFVDQREKYILIKLRIQGEKDNWKNLGKVTRGRDVSTGDKMNRDRCANHNDLSDGKIPATQRGRGHVANVYNETGRRREYNPGKLCISLAKST